MARPRNQLPANAADIVRRMASVGAGEVAIAAALGMRYKRWKAYRDENVEIAAIWEEARAAERDALVSSLFRQAVGGPAEYDDNGNLVRAEQHPHAASGMFLLKARHNYRDQGPTDEGTGRSGVTISLNLPAPLTSDQYSKLIEVTPTTTKDSADG